MSKPSTTPTTTPSTTSVKPSHGLTLTTDAGAPIHDDQHSQTAGAAGPVLLQDHRLLEKLARFNRERVPERVVHAVGSAAYGTFTVTHPDLARWTKQKLFSAAGKQTDVLVRFSTVAGSRGAADTARDPRGFAVKLYTEDGNWDLVGNNTPIFFLRDGIKFPDFIHSQKADPFTNRQEPDNIWDFFARTPEATHQFVILFSDRGIPSSYRKMDGFGSHTFQWVNAAGEKHWVKFHFKTDQGIGTLTSEEAAIIGARDPQALQKDLYDHLERGELPSWTVSVQVMPDADAQGYRFNPFDLTKVWPHADYPLHEIGKMVLERAPDNYFAEVEQSIFDPASFVPGIGPSPDRMLQARLFAYGDAHRYRVGINAHQLPVNAPRVAVTNGGRDGQMRGGTNGGRAKAYHPNGYEGATETTEVEGTSFEVAGATGTYVPTKHRDDDDFGQAGALYRLLPADEQARLVENLAGSLAQVTRGDVIARSIAHFAAADSSLGERLSAAVASLREASSGLRGGSR